MHGSMSEGPGNCVDSARGWACVHIDAGIPDANGFMRGIMCYVDSGKQLKKLENKVKMHIHYKV